MTPPICTLIINIVRVILFKGVGVAPLVCIVGSRRLRSLRFPRFCAGWWPQCPARFLLPVSALAWCQGGKALSPADPEISPVGLCSPLSSEPDWLEGTLLTCWIRASPLDSRGAPPLLSCVHRPGPGVVQVTSLTPEVGAQ